MAEFCAVRRCVVDGSDGCTQVDGLLLHTEGSLLAGPLAARGRYAKTGRQRKHAGMRRSTRRSTKASSYGTELPCISFCLIRSSLFYIVFTTN